MTLLTVVREVCAVVGVLMPQSVFSNITLNRTMQEMVALANEMAQRIAYDTRDWTKLKLTHTMTGDGAQTAFDMPANFRRMLLTANVWRSSNTLSPMTFVPDADEWMNRRVRGETNSIGEWTIIGGQMHIFPVMDGGIELWANDTEYATSVTVRDPNDTTLWTSRVAHTSAAAGTFAADRLANPTYWVSTPKTTSYFAYLDKNCIGLAGGGNGDQFVEDGDVFRIDERVLRLGMIWQWKANKGSAYAEDLATYGDALTSLMGRDSPAPILIDRKPASWNARIAYPWQVPTP